VQQPTRHKLPDERQAITHKFEIAGHEGYITVGLYEDGMPGEIFLVMAKEGSTVSGLMDAFATAISMALQYGVPLQVLADKFSHTRFEPSGLTGNAQIPFAKSITDYIFRWLAAKFLPANEQARLGVHLPEGTSLEAIASAPVPAEQMGPRAVGKPEATRFETPRVASSYEAQDDAPSCPDCGSIMVRNGACYKCVNCGSSLGCS
jgi:ribonucleoside-diphosphate reductase alpha chain